MNALVLGATGHIGAHIVRALLAEGHSVRAAYRNPRHLSLLEGLSVQRVPVDLESGEGLAAALEGCPWVFHAAAYYPRGAVAPEAAVRRGTESVRRTCEAIRAAGARRLVFTSSAATIRHVPGRPATEADAEGWPPQSWRSLYAAVKIAEEAQVLALSRQGLPAVVVNPSLCVGEYDAHTFSGRAVLAFTRCWVPWVPETIFNVVYTGDVGVGHLRAAERGRVGQRYLLAAHNVPLRAFAAAVAKEVGLPPPRWRLPAAFAVAGAWGAEAWAKLRGRPPLYTRQEARRALQGYRLDSGKAVRELGLPQTPLEEAVRRAVAWFRESGLLR